MASYEPPHLTKLRAWDSAIPRFLFRGFNEYSGGNRELNTPTAITPHAFLGKFVDIKNDKSFGSGGDTIPGPSLPTLNSMSLGAFRTEINRHLYGSKNIVSHFSSWTADFKTALRYSGGGDVPDRFVRGHPRIGVFDTSRRDHGNAIMHVRALRKEGHTRFEFDYEYLVYGPVKGISYTCLALPSRQSMRTPFCSPLNRPLYNPLNSPLYPEWSGQFGWFGRLGTWRLNEASEIRKACNRAARYSFYHAAGTAKEARWGSCTDTALYLTMIAVEWSLNIDSSHIYNWDLILDRTDPAEARKHWLGLVSDVSQVMEWAARDATLVLPLVNPHTHRAYFPELTLMVKLLLHFEAEIIKLRSKPPPAPAPSPEPWSLTRFLWGQT